MSFGKAVKQNNFRNCSLPKSDNVINILQMTKNKKNFVIYNILIKNGLYKYFNAL